MNITELFLRHGTDKHHPDGHSYGPVYEEYLEPIRSKVRHVLELGVLGGASLRTWRDYFPRAKIIGLDLVCVPSRDGRVSIIQCDVTDEAQLKSALDRSGPFDVIIDDASHWESDQLKSFELLAGRLKAGGLYFVEDIQAVESWPKFQDRGFTIYDRRAEMGRFRFDDVIAVYRHPTE